MTGEADDAERRVREALGLDNPYDDSPWAILANLELTDDVAPLDAEPTGFERYLAERFAAELDEEGKGGEPWPG